MMDNVIDKVLFKIVSPEKQWLQNLCAALVLMRLLRDLI